MVILFWFWKFSSLWAIDGVGGFVGFVVVDWFVVVGFWSVAWDEWEWWVVSGLIAREEEKEKVGQFVDYLCRFLLSCPLILVFVYWCYSFFIDLIVSR